MGFLDVSIVIIFLLSIFVVGTLFYRWIGSPDDFYLAGRELTPFIIAATLTGTKVSMYALVGQAGTAYNSGISIIWLAWTGSMAFVVAGLFVMPVLRRLEIRTIPEFLEIRYNRLLRSLVAFLWILRLAFWLAVVLYAGVISAQTITGYGSFTFWVIIIGALTVFYTVLGGMWSVTLTDVLQLILMLGGALIILPIAMSLVGWFPGLEERVAEGHLSLIPQEGQYDWKFIIAVFLIGLKWACIDQGIVQRSLSAKNVRVLAQGLVMGGIISMPFALLWVLPGVATSVIFPGLENFDTAMPTFITHYAPPILFGLIVSGFLAAQFSSIDSYLSSAATLFTSDLYNNIYKREATKQEILRVVRIATVCIGLIMIGFTYLVPLMGGMIQAQLRLVSIMDMPLFIIIVVYGLLWKRVNWQAALFGFIAGFVAGCYASYTYNNFSIATFYSAGAALITTGLLTLFRIFPDAPAEKVRIVWKAFHPTEEEVSRGDAYTLIPQSRSGVLSLVVFGIGAIMFLGACVAGGMGYPYAGIISLIGVGIYFAGGLWRAYVQ